MMYLLSLFADNATPRDAFCGDVMSSGSLRVKRWVIDLVVKQTVFVLVKG